MNSCSIAGTSYSTLVLNLHIDRETRLYSALLLRLRETQTRASSLEAYYQLSQARSAYNKSIMRLPGDKPHKKMQRCSAPSPPHHCTPIYEHCRYPAIAHIRSLCFQPVPTVLNRIWTPYFSLHCSFPSLPPAPFFFPTI